jgi:AcrR family transcriptional regulator
MRFVFSDSFAGRRVLGVAVLLLLAACRGAAPGAAQQLDQAGLDAMIDSLMPVVEQASGLHFTSRPVAAVRSREQVRQFLLAKLTEELPPARLDGLVAAYRLLGLLPDTLDLRNLFVDLYTEQIAGFYEPDSATLFAVGGADRLQLTGILAHELTHALQDQYLPLDSILDDRRDADRLAAAQAVLEGQATVVMLLALTPGRDVLSDPAVWDLLRQQLNRPTADLAVFNSAPTVIRTGLVFPYLEGSTFMRDFMARHPGEQPFGARMPHSTEQVLHPDRLEHADQPVTLRFDDDSTGVMYEDTFGEYEMLVLRSVLAGIDAVATEVPLGWGGDRMRVYRSESGPALVWYSVWDSAADAEHFITRVVAGLSRQHRAGYRTDMVEVPIGARAGARVVIAPSEWSGWSELPAVRVVPDSVVD